jgi:hypothetical protein
MVIDSDLTALLNQHRSIAQGRWRWPWQADPNDYLNQIDHIAALLCEGDAGSAYDLATDLKSAHDELDADNADTGFDLAKRDIRNWQGHAADNFAGYLYNAQGAVHHYRDVLHDFAQLAGGVEGLIAEIPNNVRALVQKAIEAQQQEAGQEGWEITFTLVAGLTAGIASVATAGTGAIVWVVLGLSTASLLGSEASAVISIDGPGETARSLLDGLQALLDEVVEKRENLRGAVDELWQHIAEWVGNKHLQDVEPNPPDIVTKPKFQPGDFKPEHEPPGIEDRVSTDPLVKPDQPTSDSKISTALAGG